MDEKTKSNKSIDDNSKQKHQSLKKKRQQVREQQTLTSSFSTRSTKNYKFNTGIVKFSNLYLIRSK